MSGTHESVAEILGLTKRGKSLDPMDLVEKLEHGLPLKSLDRFVLLVAPKDKSFAHWIVHRSTLERRRSTKAKLLSPVESEKLARLARIWSMAREIWNDEDDARQFLLEPHMLLDDRTPIEVASKTDEGARLVEGILGRLKYGSAA